VRADFGQSKQFYLCNSGLLLLLNENGSITAEIFLFFFVRKN
jgi:hypothetical protein